MLADYITAARRTIYDIGGTMSSIGHGVEQAERFVVSDDTALACLELMRSRPSSLIKALPLCRLPFKRIWVETRGGFADENTRGGVAPVPELQGSLVESIGDQTGLITVTWVHKHRELGNLSNAVNCSPFSIYFDWREDGDVCEVVRSMHRKIAKVIDSRLIDRIIKTSEEKWLVPARDEDRVEFMKHRSWWGKYATDKREVAALREHERHMLPGLCPHAANMLDMIGRGAPTTDFVKLLKNWELDIEGEGPFVEFFLAMLNSRNCIEREPVDMGRLNKARARRHKPPLHDYTNIKLVMSRARKRAADAQGISRETARWHLVRGHFKVRRTGVYWWSDFTRGDPSKGGIHREKYEVAQ